MRSMKRATASALMALLLLPAGFLGCSAARPSVSNPLPVTVLPESPADQSPETSDPASVDQPSWVTPITEENLQQVIEKYRPNEMGKVPILEYHHLGDTEERWTRRWDNFRKDLEMLYAAGYRAVNLMDYINDTMPLPAGTSPVIFTFDDGPLSQLKLVQRDGKWEAAPDSAVGIMLEFKRQHPDFGAAGTFYVNFTPYPFGEEETWKEKLKFLAENGFEVANHTRYHDDLSVLSDSGVLEDLGAQVKQIREVLPDYDGSTLALPFGLWPQKKQLAIAGEYEGVKYQHRAVLLVGSDPVHSPYDRRLDLMALPRVQAIESEFERWMPYLEQYRYVSDGDPATVVFPEDWQEHFDGAAAKGKKVYTYKSPEAKQ